MRRPLLVNTILQHLGLIVRGRNFLNLTFFSLFLLNLTLGGCKTLLLDSQAPSQSRSTTASVIDIGITTHLGDQQRFVRGDEISFLVNLNKDAYLLILYQDANKQLWQLVPNDHSKHNFFKAGEYVTIPNESLPYKFVAAPPFGNETILAFASDQPFPSFSFSLTKNGMILVDSSIDSISASLRNKAEKNRSAFGQTKLTIITQDQFR